jgi:hypothetical protein
MTAMEAPAESAERRDYLQLRGRHFLSSFLTVAKVGAPRRLPVRQLGHHASLESGVEDVRGPVEEGEGFRADAASNRRRSSQHEGRVTTMNDNHGTANGDANDGKS